MKYRDEDETDRAESEEVVSANRDGVQAVIAAGIAESARSAAISLDTIEPSAANFEVRLASGRTLRADASDQGDRLEVRGLGGEVVLRVVIGDQGPIFTFESAQLELASTGDLTLRGRNVVVEAEADMVVEVGGDRHTRVAGAERLEANSVEIQANEDSLSMRARENVLIDAEQIGLNDAPVPVPFPWSKAAKEE